MTGYFPDQRAAATVSMVAIRIRKVFFQVLRKNSRATMAGTTKCRMIWITAKGKKSDQHKHGPIYNYLVLHLLTF